MLHQDAGDDFLDLEKLHFLRIHGLDKQKRRILAIVGNLFPGHVICKKRLLQYVISKLRQESLDMKFSVVYFQASVNGNNNPGILRWIYENLPKDLKENLEKVFFVHPGLQSRFFLGTFGRFWLSEGLYWKIEYVSRVEFLWESMRKNQIEVPEFIIEHDKELERRPLMDYGIDVDPFLATEMDPSAYILRHANRMVI